MVLVSAWEGSEVVSLPWHLPGCSQSSGLKRPTAFSLDATHRSRAYGKAILPFMYRDDIKNTSSEGQPRRTKEAKGWIQTAVSHTSARAGREKGE